ncbi:TlpA disulfide reductase family protein [Bacillus sp. FSL W8-1143]|uniref:TlpA family protein disulfide reductase n=1 Tax=Bacillus TaxID=1386 RepID=UPI00203B1D78|nr:TlpA disulfide reductase family protein [Bacillus pumilus]MCM3149281.1 TlpA family protein disulfide reductase [Bacillus pumilus]MDR7250055.1 thioredoxin-related protein [Bacillus pumilus]
METQKLNWPEHLPWIFPSDQRSLSEGQQLLYFWSVNCPHCEELTDHILYRVNQLGIHLTCVHVPYTEDEKSVDVVSEYAEEKNMTAPIVLDQDYEIVAKYKIQGLPSFCLIDEEGNLIDRKMGDSGLEKILKKLEKHSIS